MSSRVVKWLFLASLFLLVFPVAAGASTARVAGMAIQGDYVKDYTGIYTYLSNVCCVGNLVYAELGNTDISLMGEDVSVDDRAVGAVLGNLWDGRFGTFAFHLRELTPAGGQGDFTTPVGPGMAFDPNFNSTQSFDLMWGKKFGSTGLGLRVNRSYGKVEEDDDTYEYGLADIINGLDLDPNFNRNVMGLGAGLGFEMTPNFSMEFGAHYEQRTFEVPFLDGAYKDDGSGAYMLAARGMWQWQPNVLVVPVFKYYSADLSTSEADGAGGQELFGLKASGWQAGLAGNWTLGSNDLFVTGLTLAQNKFKAEADTDFVEFKETLMPEMFAALETHVNPWLTLRFGARKGAFYSTKVETSAPSEGTIKWSPFMMSLGVGMKLGTLQLDATLHEDFVHNMPYLVSGTETEQMFPKVTATYSF